MQLNIHNNKMGVSAQVALELTLNTIRRYIESRAVDFRVARKKWMGLMKQPVSDSKKKKKVDVIHL